MQERGVVSVEVVSVEGLEATYGNLLELLESAEAVCETWMLKKKPKCRFISFSISSYND